LAGKTGLDGIRGIKGDTPDARGQIGIPGNHQLFALNHKC